MGNLTGKTVLITGGGSGIGLAAAQQFIAQGARVAITGRNAEKLQRAATSLGSDRVLHHAADVGEPAQVEALADRVLRTFGNLDILVNNAGLNIKARSMNELTIEDWQGLVKANMDGAFYCIHAFLPHMRERKSGLIINVNSVSGRRAGPLGGIGYAAAKFGLRGMAMCLGAEEKNNGIRVSSIYPGEVNTPILEDRPQGVSDEHRKAILQPEDVASAILYIAGLPAHVAVPELVITPVSQTFI
jgi:NADP-dependent 3-hydroxy acid dehydrogenase YdfG